ncbi:MAG: branched-chain amino acid ABC transporter permease [Rhodospirillaceae bacterium]|jgi:branched-chain amino acid transport system permease protein|nr:branched-chain amino acid ABC transporter permease [Rhodospirillaceae bacterium]MBT5195482.1 branched-chain amino acid ABC transporter permease [Rhodospirillaceae bacterium]MBT5897989.1 branched-chain amino acid ABC transporter permease [Rhodospirillaceae bacterium]MBT6429373.1 branched-chain amino acid ABC transporter permease [Rhodospirillaceae bacterium]MBT7758461.1 branched-chain amino acid ABC transporter permease [Rhodospirillaceae bacterium]
MVDFIVNVLPVQFINGLFIAAGIYLVASGLSLVFGVLGILNFAHGSFYMYGAFFVFTYVGFTAGDFWPALFVAPLIVVVLGVVMEVIFLRPIYKADPLYQLLLTYALVLIFGDLVKIIYGAENLSVARPEGFESTITFLGSQFPSYQIFVLLPAGFLTVLGLYLFLNRTNIGRTVRAATQDREMIGALGVNVRLLYTGVFAVGAFLGGLGGAVLAPMGALYPGMDFDVIIEVFLVVVLGGLGSMAGTALGALIYGELKSFGILWVPELESVFIYVLMAVVLVARPQGLMGKQVEGGH